MLLKIMCLAALVRVLLSTGKPLLCAELYAGLAFLAGLVFGRAWPVVLVTTVIGFALASLYFWLLDRLECGSALWWLIALGGLAIGLV